MAVANEEAKAGKKRVSKAAKKRIKKAPAVVPEEDDVVDPLADAKADADAVEESGATEADNEPRGVVYIGHLPQGFYEPQMWKFFGQFGTVTRLRNSRSKRTGGSKGYAFIEFEKESVAKVVAQTMQKYLLFEKVLECHLVPKDKQHPALFRGCKAKFRNVSNVRRKSQRIRHNERPNIFVEGEKLPQTTKRQTLRRSQNSKRLQAKLQAVGVSYTLDDGAEDEAAEAAPAVAPKKKGAKAGAAKKRKRAKEEPAASAASGAGPGGAGARKAPKKATKV